MDVLGSTRVQIGEGPLYIIMLYSVSNVAIWYL